MKGTESSGSNKKIVDFRLRRKYTGALHKMDCAGGTECLHPRSGNVCIFGQTGHFSFFPLNGDESPVRRHHRYAGIHYRTGGQADVLQ